MATASQANITATPTWVDATVANAALASADVLIQNVGRDVIDVVFGGASAPTDRTGIQLGPRDSTEGNAANIWIRGGGQASVTLV